MKYLAALLLALLFATGLWAAGLHDSVCKLTSERADMGQHGREWPGGSATLVSVEDTTGYLMSCAHIFENGGRSARVEFEGIRGYWRAKVIAIDHRADLSLLEINNPPEIQLPKSVQPARADDGPFSCVGFPWWAQGKQHWVSGKFLGTTRDGRVHLACKVVSGYSGGACFNKYGEFCGVVCGMTGTGQMLDRCYCPSAVMVKFINRHKPPAEVHTQCYECPPVICPPQYQPPQQYSPPPDYVDRGELEPVQPNVPSTPMRGCECADKWTAIESWQTKIDAKLKNISQTTINVAIDNRIAAYLKANPPAAANVPTMDQIAAEMQKRLQHSAQWERLDGKLESQTRPLNEPLKFQSQQVGIK